MRVFRLHEEVEERVDGGRLKMEEREQMDKPLRDLIEIIHFTENVSAKIHGKQNEVEIYRAVEEFAKLRELSKTENACVKGAFESNHWRANM